jgi:hypothetical protein
MKLRTLIFLGLAFQVLLVSGPTCRFGTARNDRVAQESG